MSKVALHSPVSIANRLFLVFLFGMVVVIGCLILFKKAPLQVQASPITQQVVLHISHPQAAAPTAEMPPVEAAPPVTH
jgi:hypothetical protein